MNLLTRISATVTGKLEEAVSHVENHDAVVAVALKDTRAAVAKARVRMQQVQKDGAAMRTRLEQLQEKETLWAERARNTAADDEAKALECVARRNQCREQITKTRQALRKHEELEHRVRENVTRMEERLREMNHQQNLMRSRQSTADAMRIINKIEDQSQGGIEATFDRWEMLITETEYASDTLPDVDSLDHAFVKEEQTAELKAELEALLSEKE